MYSHDATGGASLLYFFGRFGKVIWSSSCTKKGAVIQKSFVNPGGDMTSNGIASGAAQTAAATPAGQVSDHATAKTVREQVQMRKDAEDPSENQVPSIPANIYNSRGEVLATPVASTIDLLI